MHLEILARAIGPILWSIALSKAIFLYWGGGGVGGGGLHNIVLFLRSSKIMRCFGSFAIPFYFSLHFAFVDL